MNDRLKSAVRLLLLVLLVGCQRHAVKPAATERQAAAPPAKEAFETVLWDGKTLRGPLVLGPDGKGSVGADRLTKADISLIRRPSEAAETSGVADFSKLPPGFAPLSDGEIAQYRQRAEAAASIYKGSDSVLCLDKGENLMDPDGSKIYRYHALFAILKESGRSVADVSVYFQEGRDRARIFFIRTIFASGQSQFAGAETFTVSVPSQQAQFVDTRGRILAGKAPCVTVGCLVEYAYEQEEYNPEVKEFFFPGYIFQSNKPVLDSVVDCFVPTGTPLNFATPHMSASAAKPSRVDREAFDGYRWEMHDVPPVVSEPFMPAESDILPRMEASLFFDWKKLMAVTGKFQKERIEATPEVKSLAEEITAGKTTDDEKVAAIYAWIQKNINYLSIKASLSSSWSGHPASETLKNGYGDCTDVAVLFASLCRAVGVDAYPAIVKTNDHGTMLTDIPVPDANHAITLVYPDGRPRFLDATASDYRYPYFREDDHGIKAIIHLKEEIMDVPLPGPEDNMRDSRQEITLAPDGAAKITEVNTYTGPYEANVRGYWRYVPPELRGQVMAQYLQRRVPGAMLENFDLGDLENLDKQLQMKIDYRLPNLATRLKDLYIFSLPNFAQEFPEATLDERAFDVVLPTTACYETSVKVLLPDGYEFAGAPEPLSLRGKHLYFEGAISFSGGGKPAFEVKQVFKRLTNRIPVAEYPEYRKECAKIAAWTDLKIVLKSAPQTVSPEAEQ